MQKRLFQLLALAASLMVTGVATVLFAPRVADSTPPRPVIQQAPVTVLPAIEVRARAPVPMLPVVTIRPDRTPPTPLAAHAENAAHAPPVLLATGATTGAAFDMPYYSFGQSQRRASKE